MAHLSNVLNKRTLLRHDGVSELLLRAVVEEQVGGERAGSGDGRVPRLLQNLGDTGVLAGLVSTLHLLLPHLLVRLEHVVESLDSLSVDTRVSQRKHDFQVDQVVDFAVRAPRGLVDSVGQRSNVGGQG